MNEFNNRVDAQRQILRTINRGRRGGEELFGLSAKAIERWRSVNEIDPHSRLVELIIAASTKLLFLANKSQEQVSPEYQTVSLELESITRAIEEASRDFSSKS